VEDLGKEIIWISLTQPNYSSYTVLIAYEGYGTTNLSDIVVTENEEEINLGLRDYELSFLKI